MQSQPLLMYFCHALSTSITVVVVQYACSHGTFEDACLVSRPLNCIGTFRRGRPVKDAYIANAHGLTAPSSGQGACWQPHLTHEPLHCSIVVEQGTVHHTHLVIETEREKFATSILPARLVRTKSCSMSQSYGVWLPETD